MDFWRKIFRFFEKMTEYGTIWADQNQKNGDISVPDGQNFYRFFLSDSTSKNTPKKIGQKKIWLTPTQFFDVKGQNTGSHNVHLLEKPIIDRIKPKGVLESPKIGGNFDRGVFSISVPVSRNLSPK